MVFWKLYGRMDFKQSRENQYKLEMKDWNTEVQIN